MRLTMRHLGLLATLPIAVAAVADTRLTLEERTIFMGLDGDGPPTETTSEVTLWLGENAAARIDGASRIIARPSRGESYWVNDERRTVTVIELQSMPESSSAQVRKTGETQVIGSWRAERYELTVDFTPEDRATIVLWVSSDVGVDLDAYGTLLKSMEQGNGLMTALASLPGYPVLQEMQFGPVSSTTRLLAASDEAPPPGTYEFPGDYQRQ